MKRFVSQTSAATLDASDLGRQEYIIGTSKEIFHH
jgi:hypothetical protein